jgi:predicted Fe-S protein YdhL (DUF1289 family)
MSLHSPPSVQPQPVAANDALAPPPSPCVRNCCLDDAEVCLGCGRTLDEILEWHQASVPRRLAILDAAGQRVDSRLKRTRL